MLKKINIQILIFLLIFNLILLPALSGCSKNTVVVEDTNTTGTRDGVKDSKDLGEAEIKAETEQTEEVLEEEAGTPVRIISISPEEVFEIIENNGDYLIVDVRMEQEYMDGHLEGAFLLPVHELEERLDELPKNKPIIVYCRSGSRSRTAADTLIENGFTMVYDMGGISSWIDKGYPVIVEE